MRDSRELFYQFISNGDYLDYIEGILERIDSDISVVDTAGRVLIWNSSTETHFYSKSRALGQYLYSLFPIFTQEYKGKVWWDILQHDVILNGKTCSIPRYPLKTKEGEIRYFDLKASPLIPKAQILGAIVVMDDVTEQIRLENQLLRHARTTSLSNLGASVAHEIRNPLNSIALNIQLVKEDLEEGVNRKELIKSIKEILEEIERLNSIVKRFLDFSRPPESKLVLGDVNTSIERAAKLLMEDAKRRNINVEMHLDPLPSIPIDHDQMSEALYNIILNAIEAMDGQGGGNLDIKSSKIRNYILIEVKDSGPGIPSDEFNKIFDLFYSTKDYGTGLGLPIANQIVEKHGGKIVAENNLDRGACFRIYLPLKEEKHE